MIHDITVQVNDNGTLVVDSRLIAERLFIRHKNLLETLKKYQSEIEQAFGQIAFETEAVTNSAGAVNETKFALLTEPQATVLMTFSRNSPEVVQCKIDLVTAFQKAKDLLAGKLEKPALKKTHTIVEYIDAAGKLESLKVNPLLKRLLEDGLVDEMAVVRANTKAIAPAEKKEYTIVKVRATELGYRADDIGGGTALGKYVAKRLKYEFIDRVGRFDVKHYAVGPDLDNLIHEYFEKY